ncbi:MAG: chemotaxis protein CheW [Thermostichus sp. BF3_bins_97]
MLDLLTELSGTTLVPEPQLELTQRYLQFQVGGLAVLMPLGHLREVLSISPDRILPVPEMPPLLLGLISWRSEAIWLLDVPRLLGGSPFTTRGQGRAGVLLVETADPQTGPNFTAKKLILGLLVDSVQTILSFPPERILPLSLEVVDPALKYLFQGYLLSESGQPLLILNPQTIVQTLPA